MGFTKISKSKQTQINDLFHLIRAHKVLYYNGLAIIDDVQYDHLEDRLKELEPNHPILSQPGWNEKWLGNNGQGNK